MFFSKFKCIYKYSAITFFIIYATDSLSAGINDFASLKESRERGVVMQQWENSCAVASLATVLTYGFHDPVTEREVADKMLKLVDPSKVKLRGGFSMLDMKNFMISRGYQAEAYKNLSLEDLLAFEAPIVPISKLGSNHYVVFNGIKGNNVLVADPLFGNREVSVNNFLNQWVEGMAFVASKKE